MADTAPSEQAVSDPGEAAEHCEADDTTVGTGGAEAGRDDSPDVATERDLVGGRDVPPSAAKLVGQLSTPALESAITRRMSRLTAEHALFLAMILEFDCRNGWASQGVLSCAHWLNWKCGISVYTAREWLRVARKLENLPKLRTAFARGEVSYSKVRALTRIGTPEMDERLLVLALSATATHVERVVRGVRRGGRPASSRRPPPPDDAADKGGGDQGPTDPDSGGPAGDPPPEGTREVTAVRLADGRMRVSTVLEADEVEVLFLALRKAAESAASSSPAESAAQPPDEAGQPAAGDGSAPETEPAEVTDLDAVRAARRGDAAPIREARGSVSGIYADALLDLAESFLSHEAAVRSGDERNTLVVHVEDDVLSGAELPDLIDRCGLEPGPRLGLPTIRRFACDCTVVEATYDESEADAEARVTVPRWLRRLLRRRDGGCRYPGCSDHQWVDVHFIVHWADGGGTELTNLVLLCRRHHRYVHEFGYQIRLLADGAVEVADPAGCLVPVSPLLPGAAATPAAAASDNARTAGVPADDVVADGPSCYWTGERLDLDEAIGALFDDTKRRWSFPWFRKAAKAKRPRRSAG